jgi:GNAT superfamily N-acetyltransferase
MSDAPLYVIADGLGDAKSLVYATWLRSYEHSSPMAKNIPRAVFFKEHHKILDGIFERNPAVRLAVMPDDPSVVFGWAVSEPRSQVSIVDRDAGTMRVDPVALLHYVYVKPDFRKYGIAKALLADLRKPFIYTHWTYVLRDLERHLQGCTFNPYEA